MPKKLSYSLRMLNIYVASGQTLSNVNLSNRSCKMTGGNMMKSLGTNEPRSRSSCGLQSILTTCSQMTLMIPTQSSHVT